ncbi:MAG TPA: NAD(P)-dependent oxidoreductase [Casimicrobiaceae bacterium]|jgi:4-hydroxybutyrate dehydrogenase/sulfolactaldehyde 3-reductase|nr:NAD(P)-dependent oxidoreductase [Casimicrobiaceae bacterium]
MHAIAFIGLGVMGAPMARNIIERGFEVAVYDRSGDACSPFKNTACRIAQSPADAAHNAEILVTMLPESSDVFDALLGPNGAADALKQGALVVEMSTGDAMQIPQLAAELHRRGLRLVDAPVGRSVREATSGNLLVMAGGTEDDINQARPMFEALADTIIHVGPLGSGIKLKLVNNYMSMVGIVLTGETLMFAAKLGLPRQIVVDVLSSTAAGQGQLSTNYRMKVLAGDITADFPMRMAFKDINLALSLAADVGAPLGLGAYAREMFALAKSWGRENQDYTAMLLLLEDISRVTRGQA